MKQNKRKMKITTVLYRVNGSKSPHIYLVCIRIYNFQLIFKMISMIKNILIITISNFITTGKDLCMINQPFIFNI
ncbi:MAG: hypothetical protein K0S41_2307 [Anaerocolumna sp.]|jgi:hypothetical protein|nr:hypothetical protein [Anaerocolumna sp.]